jgi:putative ABC transport system substrate-binding protein
MLSPARGSGMQFGQLKRRDFFTLIGGTAATWPIAARAQPRARPRRVGMLMVQAASDPDGQERLVVFSQALQHLGWVVGRNLQLELRWAAGDAAATRQYAEELVALAPDVVVTSGAANVAPLLQATRTVPIVFVLVADPVGAGFINSLSRPGGNATGFTAIDYSFGGKQLELLKEIAPGVKRVAVVRDPSASVGIGLFGAIQLAAPSLGMDVVVPVGVREPTEVEREIEGFVRGRNDGMIVTASGLAFVRRELFVSLATKHKLPAVYPARPFVAVGGLISYSPSITDQYRQAASYVDRILKGEKPADLPVQQPTKFELVLNLKTAKALGLEVPPPLLARADEVIE